MELKELLAHLKSLTIDEIKKLAILLEQDVETKLGLSHNGKSVAVLSTPTPPPPPCGPGYYWDVETQSCILDIGG